MSNQLDSGCAIIHRTSEVTAGKAQGSSKKMRIEGRIEGRALVPFVESGHLWIQIKVMCFGVSISETYRRLSNKIKRV